MAQHVRDLDSKIPLYLLTSASEEFSDLGPSDVEYIISKNDIDNDKATHAISARLRRHHDTYSDIVSERANRLDYLLSKHLDGTLDNDEEDEFNTLNLIKDKIIALQESNASIELKKILDEQEEKIKKINDLISKLR